MIILSLLNISNIDNLNCDSGYIFQKQLGLSLIELGHRFILVIPHHIESVEIEYLFHNFGDDKFEVRFSFAWKQITEIITVSQPDIILSNQSELSASLKALIVSEGFTSKLCTYVHYYPFSLGTDNEIQFDSSLNNANLCQSIILSFLSGLVASDKIFIHSQYAMQLLIALFKFYNLPINELDITILPPPYDKYLSEASTMEPKNNIILYNHRLYKQYGTDFLISFISEIQEKFDWRIVITDLLFNRSINRARLDNSVDKYRQEFSRFSNVEFRIDGNDRTNYKSIINSSMVSLAPYRKNCTWSMSVVDCMAAGIPVVAPNFAWFSEFIPEELVYDSKAQMISLIQRLFTDKIFYKSVSFAVKDVITLKNHLSAADIAQRFIKAF